jgi:phenylalanyl-tRNA synthetase beta chain
MRVPLSWLAEFVDPGDAVGALADRLTMGGLAVEAIEQVGDLDPGVRVGRIESVAAHPHAERLSVCVVDVGEGGRHTVVSGAPGLAAGQRVPVALAGTRLPDGRTLAAVELRGVASAGMLCSERELGLGDDGARVLVLDEPVRPGVAVRELPGVRDTVLEIDVTPNRGDCLSVLGIAREVGALGGGALRPARIRLREAGAPADVCVRIDATDGCPRYVARVVRALAVRESPLRVRLRLRRAGMRPINAVVDATNLVMLERGQPLHAFDADRIAERAIMVRRARAGERVVTLDDADRLLDARDLVIADGQAILAIAGVMGGRDSEVRPETSALVLESAFFDPASVRRTARRLGLVSQAAYRFERRVDPAELEPAIDRAAALIAELTGGVVAPGRVVAGPGVPPPATVALRPARAERLLGMSLPRGAVRRSLRALGAATRSEGRTLLVTPPTFRGDLAKEEDLVEEIARVAGYDRIPVTTPVAELSGGCDTPARRLVARVRQALVAEGLCEVVTAPFCSADHDALVPGTAGAALTPLRVRNPLSAETGTLRRSPLLGVLGVLATNLGRGAEFVGVFEIGKGYGVDAAGRRQEPRGIVLALAGTWPPCGTERRGPAASVADAQGIVENLLARVSGENDEWRWRRAADVPFLHPGKSAWIETEGARFGVVGTLHPRIVQVLDLPTEIVVAELDFQGVGQYRPARLGVRPLPRFPSVTRDIAMVVDDDFAADAIRDEVRALAEPLIESVRLFDCYRGAPIPPGKKSLAYTIAYRAPDRTLTDEEVNALQDRVRRHLAGRFALELRS